MRKSTIAVIVVIIVIVLSLGIYFALFSTPPSSTKLDSFAQCISEKGATMYGAYWCTHCQAEKKLFGSSFQYVNYVECDPNGENAQPQLCQKAGIDGYPTWVINGTKYEDEQSFQQLARATGCPAP
jgi:glutaredoxin